MDMLLETLKIEDGYAENADMHLDRMMRSSAELWGCGIHADPAMFAVPDGFRKGTVKCRILYSRKGVEEVQYMSYVPRAVKTLRAVVCDTVDYHLKYADRSVLERLCSMKDGCDDILVVRSDGTVTDTSFSNVVVKVGDKYFTPSDFLLDGCRRRSLIASGRVEERKMYLHDIRPDSEIFIVNSMLDLGEVPPARLVL